MNRRPRLPKPQNNFDDKRRCKLSGAYLLLQRFAGSGIGPSRIETLERGAFLLLPTLLPRLLHLAGQASHLPPRQASHLPPRQVSQPLSRQPSQTVSGRY